MTKITVYRYDEMNTPVMAEGWFTLEDAEAIPEADPMTAATPRRCGGVSQREESKRRCTAPVTDAGFSRPLGISMNAEGLLTMNQMSTRVLGVVVLAIGS